MVEESLEVAESGVIELEPTESGKTEERSADPGTPGADPGTPGAEIPPKPEDLARQLFASYLEVPEPAAQEGEPAAIAAADTGAEAEGLTLDAREIEEELEPGQEPDEGQEAEGGRQWYVIHSYSGYENKVKKNLEHRIESLGVQDKIFQIVVPTEEEIELKDGQRRTVERRIFPGYILVEMVMDEDSWYVVRNTPGVTGFVGSVRKPTPLRKRDVDKILGRMEAETPRVSVRFRPGEKVRICDGPFEDFVGSVDDIFPDKGKVRILVSFFGRETPVELDFLQVERL
jgi:transcription termination/antitermination protein NusG